jgi:hypothetical protein
MKRLRITNIELREDLSCNSHGDAGGRPIAGSRPIGPRTFSRTSSSQSDSKSRNFLEQPPASMRRPEGADV